MSEKTWIEFRPCPSGLMKWRTMRKLIVAFFIFLTLACSVPLFLSQPTDLANPSPARTPTFVPVALPTETPLIIPTDTTESRSESAFPLPYNENIMISLATVACTARWSNNLAKLPCPGGTLSQENGAIDVLDQTRILNEKTVRNHTLLTIPGYGSNGGGIFGRYPAYKVESGKTHFMAGLTCVSFPCQADFGLAYYDQARNYHDLVTWKVDSASFSAKNGFWEVVDYDLSSFVGQSIELVLVVRNLPNQRVEALWIEPMIYLKY
jgi:hypothetical protein